MTESDRTSNTAVINVGLPLFADAVRQQGALVQDVAWTIPAEGDSADIASLKVAYGESSAAIDESNNEVVRRLNEGIPLLTGVVPAQQAVDAFADGMLLLHSGPPIEPDHLCDPLLRSMTAAAVCEGWARTVDEAEAMVQQGKIRIAPANDHGAVVPMATAMGPTTPVWVAEDAESGMNAIAPVNQGSGDVAWFGKNSDGARKRLDFLREVAQPRLASVLKKLGPIDIFSLAAQGLVMGDDVHIRTQATTNLLIRDMLPGLAELPADDHAAALAEYLATNHLFYLTIAMAGAKSLTRHAEQVPDATIVTTMARNGTDFGIKRAGSDAWVVTAAPPVGDALFYPGFGPSHGAPDIGDSAVLELVGLGGAAAAGSPAVAAFLGGSMADAERATNEMRRICSGTSTRLKLPIQEFTGTPVGVDLRKVVETHLTPKVTTGILHASSGEGQIGAGVATAPVDVFRQCLKDFTDQSTSGGRRQ